METLRSAFLAKYPKYEIILRMYEEANNCPAAWSELSKLRLQTFVDYMSERLSPNSVRQYCAKLKSVLNLYNEEVTLPKDYSKILNVKNVKCANTWLTEDDLQKIVAYEPKNDNERIVKSQFLIGAYSGARHSDFMRFDKHNIVGGYITYVSQKTKIQAIVPLKPIVAELLANMDKRKLTEPTFNDIIRRICKKCGITDTVKVFKAGQEITGEKWEFVTSHTARRSFATNLYLLGLDIYTISRFLGHSSVEMTAQNYICCSIRNLSDEIMGYFS